MGIRIRGQGMHILHIASEMAGVVKVGGLGDVILGLSRQLSKRGHRVELILPKYTLLNYEAIEELQVINKEVWSYYNKGWHHNTIWSGWAEGIHLYLIDPNTTPEYFDREQVYGYEDDVERFTYFCRAALEFLLKEEIQPDILHLHEWQMALIAPLYREIFTPLGLNHSALVFTTHNLKYQGVCEPTVLEEVGLSIESLLTPEKLEDDQKPGMVNLAKGGIVYADRVTTVSPSYFRELQTPGGGHGLEKTVLQTKGKWKSILNGIDTERWGPGVDPYLPLPFDPTPQGLQRKEQVKEELRNRFGLAQETRPLVSCIARLVPQKGVHLIQHAILHALQEGAQFILLGSSPILEISETFHQLKMRLAESGHVHIELHHHEELVHLIYGGSDLFIVPSIFEPCGLTQLIALKYGTVPLVRKTGGLADTICDIDDPSIPFEERNGFLFEQPTSAALEATLDRALTYWTEERDLWQRLVLQGMQMDYSWEKPALLYERVYEEASREAIKGDSPLSSC